MENMPYMPRISCELINSKTGRQIAWTWGVTGAERWEWVSRTMAREYECDPDDVDCVDTDDRFDNITIRGEMVAYMKSDLMGSGS